MTHRQTFIFTVAILAASSVSYAARPAKELLPNSTKGYVSIPDPDAALEHWDETDWGRMAQDPLMKPFRRDLDRQLQERFDSDWRLGLTWDDLKDVYGGEVCFARIQPNADKNRHAMAVIVDITGKDAQANQLLQKVHTNLTARRARRTVQQVGQAQVISYSIPPRKAGEQAHTAHYLKYKDHLVACDHTSLTSYILKRIDVPGQDCIASLDSFKTPIQHCSTAANALEPHVIWWAEPFGYAHVLRASQGGRKKRGTDTLQVLEKQGFKAIRGIAGYINFTTEEKDILHRSYVYAPGANKGLKNQFALAARMLQFPNEAKWQMDRWIPTESATRLTFNWKMRDAFEYSRTLVNELADEEIFEDLLDSIKSDPLGPRIDIRKELVAFFGDRATYLTDHRQPIGAKSERILFGIDVTNSLAVSRAVEKAMSKEPFAEKRVIEGRTVWEIRNDRQAAAAKPPIDIDGFDEFGFDDEEDDIVDDRSLPNSAITVIDRDEKGGVLLVASHVDHILDVFKQLKAKKTLADMKDYQTIQNELDQLGAGADSFRFFSRTDQAYRPTYELMKAGKMPEAETVLAKALNQILGSGKKDEIRKQEVDGSQLPEFEKVQKYLGPAGLFVKSRDDGWLVTGCLLKRSQVTENGPRTHQFGPAPHIPTIVFGTRHHQPVLNCRLAPTADRHSPCLLGQ